LLADLMLPDGAHDRNEDWTVFFLNQTPRMTLTHHPNLKSNLNHSIKSNHSNLKISSNSDQLTQNLINPTKNDLDQSILQIDQKLSSKLNKNLLYVISLVRTKKDNSVRRKELFIISILLKKTILLKLKILIIKSSHSLKN
ncbi:hypothetical protein O181_071743, partial [Austropuccinia psidii MF-1]|nr:hypothetical protein [Austropuccinia psidii MF-1]